MSDAPGPPPATDGRPPDAPPTGDGDHAGDDPAAAMRVALSVLDQPPSGRGHAFVSDLSVGELVLLDEVGYEPVDLVFGAGAASWNPQAATVPQGADAWAWALTTALTTARQAVNREVLARSADGVVAVHMDLHRHPGNMLTCTLVGTAVHRRQVPAGAQHHTEPFSTTLSAGDFHLLVRAGYLPAAMVVGAAVAGFPARSVAQGLGLSRDNTELTDQTAALYAAREQAMTRLEAETRQAGADGVVAVSFSEHPFTTVLVRAVELLVVGTAVRRGADGHRPLDPHLQLGLDDPPPDVFQQG